MIFIENQLFSSKKSATECVAERRGEPVHEQRAHALRDVVVAQLDVPVPGELLRNLARDLDRLLDHVLVNLERAEGSEPSAFSS